MKKSSPDSLVNLAAFAVIKNNVNAVHTDDLPNKVQRILQKFEIMFYARPSFPMSFEYMNCPIYLHTLKLLRGHEVIYMSYSIDINEVLHSPLFLKRNLFTGRRVVNSLRKTVAKVNLYDGCIRTAPFDGNFDDNTYRHEVWILLDSHINFLSYATESYGWPTIYHTELCSTQNFSGVTLAYTNKISRKDIEEALKHTTWIDLYELHIQISTGANKCQ